MGNKRIITYAAAVWLAFSFVSTDMIVRAYEANEPIMLESETPNIEEVEDRPDLLLSEQDSLNEAEEIIVEESVSSTTLEGTAEAVPSVRPVWPGGGGEIKDTTAEAPQIVTHPEVFPYVIAGTDYETPVYTCSARLPEGIMQGKITYTWYVDENVAAIDVKTAIEGEEITDTYKADDLTGLTDYGVHPVYCVVSMDVSSFDEDGSEIVSAVSNQSMSVNFYRM